MLTNPENQEPNNESSEDLPNQIDLPVQQEQTDRENLIYRDIPSQKTIAGQQEETRSRLATSLIFILGGTLLASFALILGLILLSGFFIDKDKAEQFDKTSSLVKDLITFILTAQTGLIGTALGFYFGSKSGNSD